MTFQIIALDPGPFVPLFALDAAALGAHRARRVVADSAPGFPCRVSLVDAEPGETLLLVNHRHLGGDTPYAASHAIYVREGAARAVPGPGDVPLVLRRRLLSVRAFDADSMMIGADVVAGEALAPHLEGLFDRGDTGFVHLHYAGPGCFAAAVVRGRA